MEQAATPAQAQRTADKIIEALSTLAALLDRTISEVKKNLDSDIQARVIEAVHQTESLLQSQTAEHVERVRQEVQEQLTSKYQLDVQSVQSTLERLRADYEGERDRLGQQLAQAASALTQLEAEKSQLIAELYEVKQSATAEVDKIRVELSSKSQQEIRLAVEELTSKYTSEREGLGQQLTQITDAITRLENEKSELLVELQQVKQAAVGEIDQVRSELSSKAQQDVRLAVEDLTSKFTAERERLEKELRHAVDAAATLESERSGLITEVQRVKDEAGAQVEKARAEARAAAASAPAPVAGPTVSATIQKEITDSEAKLQELIKLIEDPAAALSAVIRKNVEKSEVEAYLRGIRYVLNGGT